MIRHAATIGAKFLSSLLARAGLSMRARLNSKYVFECRDKDGHLRWREEVSNLVVNVGLNDVLTQYFKGSSYTAAFFIGLFGGDGTLAAADTMASHAGWTEITAFSNSTRPALTLGSVSAQAVDNSGSPAVFNINGTTTVLGGFVTTNSTVGGSSGTLYGEAAFANSRTLYNLDTLTVTIQLSAATG